MRQWQEVDPGLAVVAGVAGFLLLWLTICIVIAKVGGWTRLAARYRQSTPVRGKTLRAQRGALRYGTAYNNVLNLTVSHHGLGLLVVVLFRAGHAPLLLPWADITVSREQSWAGPVVRLALARVPTVGITLSERTVERLRKLAGEWWPER